MGATDAALMRELYDRFNAGEYERTAELLHPEVELHQWTAIPDTDTYVGREQFVRGISRWIGGFEPGFQFRVEDVREQEGRVWMRVRLSGRGRESGVPLEHEVVHVWEVRDRMGFRCRVFSNEEEAWRALAPPR
ncbi:MAG: nuclear transport factor 2 family protein [Solirubrobacterales bacterium]